MSLNRTQHAHWTTTAGLKKKVLNEIVYEIETQEITPFPHSHVHIERRACKPLDYDNLVGGLKGTVDVLRGLGLIANDDVRSVDIHYMQESTRRLWAKTILRFWK